MDIAVVSAACFITLDKNEIIKDLKISLGAVAPTVIDINGLDAIVKNSVLEDELLSKIILHAPQSPVLQPSLVPVSCKSFLKTSSKVSSGLHKNSCSFLFTETLTCNFFNFFSCPFMSKYYCPF